MKKKKGIPKPQAKELPKDLIQERFSVMYYVLVDIAKWSPSEWAKYPEEERDLISNELDKISPSMLKRIGRSYYPK